MYNEVGFLNDIFVKNFENESMNLKNLPTSTFGVRSRESALRSIIIGSGMTVWKWAFIASLINDKP
jgi:hypothetical protein